MHTAHPATRRVAAPLALLLVLLGALFTAPQASATLPGEEGKIVFAGNYDVWTVNPMVQT